MSFRVTIVSAYHGNRDMTQKFMDRLNETITDKDRVILVSSGNEPNTGEIVWSYPKHWDYIFTPVNIGFSHAMNLGIKKALETDTEYIMILGNDGFPLTQDWLDHLMDSSKEHKAMITCPEPTRPNIAVYNRLIFNRLSQRVTSYIMFPAICWLIRKADVELIGLFDEIFGVGTYEDDDYCKRVRDVGGLIIVDHSVKLDHKLSQTSGKFDLNTIMAENQAKFEAKWAKK